MKAALRIECYFQSAPKANQSSVAAHLINYSLHCVNDRLRDHKDPRMSSLRSVNNLVSLPLGDKTQYKWGKRQPVRRRRGDVHKDLTVVALHLHWEGDLSLVLSTIAMSSSDLGIKDLPFLKRLYYPPGKIGPHQILRDTRFLYEILRCNV